MFEAHSKSQPKLVYAYAGHSHSTREQEGHSSQATRSLVTVTNREQQVHTSAVTRSVVAIPTKDKVKEQDPVTQRSKKSETQIHIFQSQQPRVHQKEQHKDLQEPKHEGDRREIKQLEVQRQPKQIEVGYISTKKGPTVSVALSKKEDICISFAKQSDVVNNKLDKKSPQLSNILYNSDTSMKQQATTTETYRSHGNELSNREKYDFEKVEHSLKPTAAISAENKAKLILSSSTSEHHAFSISSKSSHDALLDHVGSSATDNSAPKQEYVHSLLLKNSQQTHQQHLQNQKEQQNILPPQHHQQVSGDLTKEVQETRLHVTSIKVPSNPIERKQTWPLIPNSEQSQKIQNTTTIISHQSNSMTMSSSKGFPEEVLKSETKHHDTLPEPPPPSYTVAPTANPPKSILKNSTSFDQTDLSFNPHSFIFSGHDRDNSPNYDFRSLLISSKDTTSIKKVSTNMFKGKIQSPFMDKFNSPPPQRKGRQVPEPNSSKNEIHKEALVAKKSVTFDSQVRLHLNDQMSTVETLPVDA